MTLAAWLHDLDPFIVRFGGGFGIRWYGFAYVLAFIVAYTMLRWMARRGMTLIPEHRVGDVVVIGAIGAVVGGRLGYVLFYQPSLLWTFGGSFPWWGAIDLMRGGMASHGGVIGALVAGWRVSRGFKDQDGVVRGRAPFMHVMDTFALVTPQGLFWGRLANFINGELLGKVVAGPGEPAPWWAVKFPQEVLTTGRAPELSPEQAMRLERLVADAALPGDSWPRAYERVLERVQEGAPDLAARLEPLISARHPSQLYQAFAEGIVLGAVLWLIARKPRTTGVIGGWFAITYGVLRVITEIWRLPDAHLAVERPLGLSRGQWFSIGLVLVGIGILVWSRYRGGPKLGGWASRHNGTEARRREAESETE